MQLAQIKEELNNTSSNNAYPRFSSRTYFLAANSFYITPPKPQETSPNNYDFASDPADATGDPVNNSDPSGMSGSGCTSSSTAHAIFGISTCIQIDGWSNMVQDIKMSGYPDTTGCSVAQTTINGDVKFQAPEVCVSWANGAAGERELSASWGCPFSQTINQCGSINDVGGWRTDKNGIVSTPFGGGAMILPNGDSPFHDGDKVCARFVGTDFNSGNSSSPLACLTIHGSAIPTHSLPTVPKLPSLLPWIGPGPSGLSPDLPDPNIGDTSYKAPSSCSWFRTW